MQEIILKSTGEAVIRTITENHCAIAASLADQLSSTAVRVVKNLFLTPTESIGLTASNNEVHLGCRLNKLSLLTNWVVVDGFLVPRPDKDGGSRLKMEWEPHNAMTILFVARIEPGLHIGDRKCYLLALDSGGRNHQLPLPNVYDDCSVCMGEFDSQGQSYLECFQKALAQFRNAPWNADLMTGDKSVKLEKLVRFKVVNTPEGDVFEREGSGSLWWNQCVGARETRVTDAARRLL